MVSALALRNYDPGCSSYLASQLWLCFSTMKTRCCGAGFTQNGGAVVKVPTEEKGQRGHSFNVTAD